MICVSVCVHTLYTCMSLILQLGVVLKLMGKTISPIDNANNYNIFFLGPCWTLGTNTMPCNVLLHVLAEVGSRSPGMMPDAPLCGGQLEAAP